MLKSGIDDVELYSYDSNNVFDLVESQRSALQKMGFLDRVIPGFIFKFPNDAPRLLSIQYNLSCFKNFAVCNVVSLHPNSVTFITSSFVCFAVQTNFCS